MTLLKRTFSDNKLVKMFVVGKYFGTWFVWRIQYIWKSQFSVQIIARCRGGWKSRGSLANLHVCFACLFLPLFVSSVNKFYFVSVTLKMYSANDTLEYVSSYLPGQLALMQPSWQWHKCKWSKCLLTGKWLSRMASGRLSAHYFSVFQSMCHEREPACGPGFHLFHL